MDVALEEHRQFNAQHQSKEMTKSQKKSVSVVRDMMGRRLRGYFNYWKDHSTTFSTAMNTKIRDRIFKIYRDYMLSYFSHWRKNATEKKVRKKKKMIMQMED